LAARSVSLTLETMKDGDFAQPCAVQFWTFATPVLVGNLTALAVRALVKAHYSDEPVTTRDTAATFATFGAFWIAAGLTWISLNRRNGVSVT
jgi:hypothetical protein